MNSFLSVSKQKKRRAPIGAWMLLGLMVGVYLLTLILHLPYGIALQFGVLPEHPNAFSLIASLFFHVSGAHLFVNAFLLWLFSGDLEDALGTPYYLLLFIFGGIATNIAQIGMIHLFIVSQEILPIVGASGAVSVIIGGYAVMFPKAKYERIKAPIIIPKGIPVIAFWGIWLLIQVAGTLAAIYGWIQNVGYAAHVIGFILGCAATLAIARLPGVRSRIREIDDPLDLNLSTDTQALMMQANAAEMKMEWIRSKWLAETALSNAVEKRSTPDAWKIYQWMMDRNYAEELPLKLRLELAALLQNENRIDEALILLNQLSEDSSDETASRGLLMKAGLLALSLNDRTGAEETWELLERRYPRSFAASLISSQKRRILAKMSGQNPPDEKKGEDAR